MADLCTLANTFDPHKHDVSGWLATEKFDGVRALWVPEEGRFISRSGKPLIVPPSWLNALKDVKIPLDGEFWMGRGRFQDVVSVARKKNPAELEFAGVQYVVFDAPKAESDDYLERLSVARAALANTGLPHFVVEPVVMRDNDYAINYARQLMLSLAEGIMLRPRVCPYEYKRTSNLLKLKGCIDGIATVVGMGEGEGKHAGRMGYLVVWDWGTGVTFKVGTGFTDKMREDYWRKRNTDLSSFLPIRWSAHELTRDGVPRHPTFICEHKGD